MGKSATVLLGFRSAIDYCQPSASKHDRTKPVLDKVYERDIRIDMRRACWKRLGETVTNVLNLFQYLRKEASAVLQDHDPSRAQDIYNETVLTTANLGRQEFELDPTHMPSMADLRDGVEGMGLSEFREFAHAQVRDCIEYQTRLDMMLYERYEPSGEDPWIIEASIDGIFSKNGDEDLILGAYKWSLGKNGFLITRGSSEIFGLRDEIHEIIDDRDLKIVSPEVLDEYID